MAFVQWEPDAEFGAVADIAFHFDTPAVLADDALDDHQSEAAAFFLGRVKRFENVIDLFLCDSATGVGNTEPNASEIGRFR